VQVQLLDQLAVTVILDQPQPQVAAQVAYGIQQLQGAPADRAVAAEMHHLMVVALEYQEALALQDKGVQADQVYASTMTEKTHTTVVVVVVQAALD
jgi:hypothetical protein